MTRAPVSASIAPMRRRETPTQRKNPGGDRVWVARWTDKDGVRRYGWAPDIPGTHKLKRDAQAAIDACYEREDAGPAQPSTFGAYAATWTTVHPRSRRTNRTNESRLRAVLDVTVSGAPLRQWPFDRLKRKQANELVDFMLREQARAYTGVANIIGTLRAMAEDALDDEVITANPFMGVRVRANDPRIQKARRKVRVWSWEAMHGFALACVDGEKGGQEVAAWRATHAEAMVRMLSDCGLRIGELLPLYVSDVDLKEGLVDVRWTESIGEVLPGTKTDHGEMEAGRVALVPPDLCEMLRVMLAGRPTPLVPPGEDRSVRLRPEALLFPSPRGRLWDYADWWRDVWVPGRVVAGVDPRPHEFRHSYVSLLRAAGVDPADLARVAGHTVETATAKYTHSTGQSFDAIKRAVGS